MHEFRSPYGRGALTLALPDAWRPEWLAPTALPVAADPLKAVGDALDSPVCGKRLAEFAGVRSAAIAVNDKTRPVPHAALLPPLLQRLEAMGLPPKAITLLIATGTHPPMPPDEFAQVIPPDILARYPVVCHDCEDRDSLVHLGKTQRGTPVWIHRLLAGADLRLVVGNIEPHQFQGFSGGVKSAAIGLAGKQTVNHNHAMMTDPRAALGCFDDNPPRQDVEEIGRMIGVHFALNAILNESKQIVSVVAGEPTAVMQRGIPLALRLYLVRVTAPFDLIIASPGGHPKDINLYQSQKALAHAARVTRDAGTVILVAACPEGTGSRSYEQWMEGMTSHAAVVERFRREGYRIGPHKAFQIARDASRVQVLMLSQMAPDFVRRLLLTPVGSLEDAVAAALKELKPGARIGIMPWANSTMPTIS
ncbi:MAG: nickel-dependent lactate racemase [Verrucomicrobia bacterium]|nr:nickel-dependent lactate racemase [Verrucomicrobiota bacterium]